jgi:hypothetical protein
LGEGKACAERAVVLWDNLEDAKLAAVSCPGHFIRSNETA